MSPATAPFIVCHDSREQKPPPFPEGVILERWTLSEGDYTSPALQGIAAIERKSLGDFANSISRERERLDDELRRLVPYKYKCIVVERDRAKRKALGLDTRLVALSEPRTPRLEMRGQRFTSADPVAFQRAGFGYNSVEEYEAHAKLARRIRDQAQAAPATPMERHLDALGIPWRSSPESLAMLRDSVKATALSGKPRELPASMFRSRNEGGSGPFGGAA